MSLIGWIHVGFGIAALASGAVVVARPKGTSRHRVLGRIYVGAMTGLLGTAFLIYRLFDGWGVFHWLAVAGALTLLGGFGSVRLRRPAAGWIDLHYHLMGYSYVGLLAATGAEAAVRVPGTSFTWAAAGASVVVTAVGAFVIHARAGEVITAIRGELTGDETAGPAGGRRGRSR